MKLCKNCVHMDLSSVEEMLSWDGAVCNHPGIRQVHPVSGEMRRPYCIVARAGKCGRAALLFTAYKTFDEETTNAQ